MFIISGPGHISKDVHWAQLTQQDEAVEINQMIPWNWKSAKTAQTTKLPTIRTVTNRNMTSMHPAEAT